ncbi:MerR family transcriptional regulator [Nocardioides cheoyonin]|uniref:MerR family transcriptional regulator n=1 Tax=Nocardioides cheoyonin TaxID=3156615 RepID=UPI003CCC62B0
MPTQHDRRLELATRVLHRIDERLRQYGVDPESSRRDRSMAHTPRSAYGAYAAEPDHSIAEFNAALASRIVGVRLPELERWTRSGLVTPSASNNTEPSAERLYSFRDLLVAKVTQRLLDAGISSEQIKPAVEHLRQRGTDDLTRVTLMSDGVSVYEVTSTDEVIDLLHGGSGVFAIAIGGVWRELEGQIAEQTSA